MKRRLILISLVAILLFAGCGSEAKLLNEYNQKTNNYDLGISNLNLTKANGFASDLGVIDVNEPDSDKSYELHSQIALLVDSTTGEVLFQKNAHQQAYPASTTKILTALLAIKYGDHDSKRKAGDEVIITEENAMTCDYRVGDDIPFDIALNGTLIRSGNDAAAFLSTFVEESQEDFAKLMNEEARKLGATNSNFVNPHGLMDENHYTTAYDLYLIYREALKYDYFKNVIGAKSYSNTFQRTTIYNTYQIPCTYTTSNPFFTDIATAPSHVEVLGGKSGYTEIAKRCYILHANANGHEYICIVMKADNYDFMCEDLVYLLNCIPE